MTGSSTLPARAAVAALAALTLPALGCHSYTTVQGAPDVGRTVEVDVDTARWGAAAGGGHGRTLSGRVVSASGDSVRLAVSADELRMPSSVATGEDTVAVPLGAAERMRYRSISVWKSAAVAVAVVSATAVTFEVAASGGGVSGGGPGPGGPDEGLRLRIPLLSW